MKKLTILAILLVVTCTVALAQPRAIGGRINYGIGASYQHGFGEKNMLQIDLDLPGLAWGIQAVGTYDWIFSIKSWSGPGSWNWYAGVGAGAGWGWWWNYGWAGIAGMVGVEYNFKFPLQLSLDFRPLIGPSFHRGWVGFAPWTLYYGSFGLGVRYKF